LRINSQRSDARRQELSSSFRLQAARVRCLVVASRGASLHVGSTCCADLLPAEVIARASPMCGHGTAALCLFQHPASLVARKSEDAESSPWSS